MNKKIRNVVLAIAMPLGAIGFWYYHRAEAREAPAYRFATVERGSLRSTVSATGALSAVRTVQVGTQVSGQLAAIYVDFNDRVKKGQLLARIDPTLQEQGVQDAQAQLAKAQAQYNLSRENFERNKTLHEGKIITETEYQASQADYAVAGSSVRSAEISLQRAKQNLSYTSIYSPIDGVIVERNVDVGQTVAASLSAPQLFLIANDLSQMQILASVDESDIGQISEGQPVDFTVQAYPNQKFTGTVQQVRLQSTTTENVVNYTVVVAVKNPDGKLLPGMTATVAFSTGSANDVMTVSNTALRFRPTDEMLAAAGLDANGTPVTAGGDSARGRAMPTDSAARAAFIAQRRAARGGSTSGATGASGQRPTMATLWFVDSTGKLSAARVRTGLTDGQKTEIQSPKISAGMQVIVGTTSGQSSSGAASNPFQPQGGSRRGPGGF
jgi:HlyD family secretion protein